MMASFPSHLLRPSVLWVQDYAPGPVKQLGAHSPQIAPGANIRYTIPTVLSSTFEPAMRALPRRHPPKSHTFACEKFGAGVGRSVTRISHRSLRHGTRSCACLGVLRLGEEPYLPCMSIVHD